MKRLPVIVSTYVLSFIMAAPAVFGTECICKAELNKSVLPVDGKYRWEFEVPGAGKQTLIYSFTDSVINLDMTGKALTRNYDLSVLSYNRKTNKIIAKGINGEKKGVFAVIFLKDIRKNSVLVFKKEFPTQAEAESFNIPSAESTESHGWNKFDKIPENKDGSDTQRL
ncbi:MAG: hypothetical protein M9904_03530 [Chitinophagaceae bacterium]|nr:hypothetical protein [Chitinophagaceae bacterium]